MQSDLNISYSGYTDKLSLNGAQETDLTSQLAGSALEELKQLGVKTFQASELENTVVRQMDENLEHEAAYRSSPELTHLKADLEQAKVQLSRLKSQCKRLDQQDKSDPDVRELYRECFGAYRKKKTDIAEFERKIIKLMASLDARVDELRATRLKQERENPNGFDFELGMRTTTRVEQDAMFHNMAGLREAQIDSSSSSSSCVSGVDITEKLAADSPISIPKEKADPVGQLAKSKRKRDSSGSTPLDDEEEAMEATQKRTYYGENGKEVSKESVQKPRFTPARGATLPKDPKVQAEDDLEDEVEALLDEFQPSKNDDMDLDDEEMPTDLQRVKRTVLGDSGDDQPGRYLERVEKWILEHKDDPRSREIRKLRKWLATKEKSDFARGSLTEEEKGFLERGLPQRIASVERNDEMPTIQFDGGFELPKYLYKRLFEHQRVAVRWLWELHQQEAGGILGDEMGLGKTLEIIGFLNGLMYSGLLSGPILIVCPTTLVSHWIREFHWWAPEFAVLTYRGSGESVPISPVLERCAEIFDQSNAFSQLYDEVWTEIKRNLESKPKSKSKRNETEKIRKINRAGPQKRSSKRTRSNDMMTSELTSEAEDVDVLSIDHPQGSFEDEEAQAAASIADSEDRLLDEVLGQIRRCEKPEVDEMEAAILDRVDGHTPVVLIVSYETVRMNISSLTRVHWHYAIMDEGHKLRNPEAAVTQACKRLPTPHRMLLTGTPIQNNLVELWSLFDFCFPGKLGTLETFEKHFAWPIQRGGYATASPMEVRVAYKCALTLRDLVNPYLLRRSKDQVNIKLPGKSEQILFCQLTNKQREDYKAFLRSADAAAVYQGLRNMLYGVDMLRKICNHSFLLEPDHGVRALLSVRTMEQLTEGSAKLKVLNHILAMWKQQGHRVLIFAQTVQMLNIIEVFIKLLDYNYLRMDGQTASSQRQKLVDRFNEATSDDPDQPFVFLLTTRVGGLGINLTSANRVIVYDPDWNPMTDLQAKERAYRIGQSSHVIVYRLVTSGTIEEKIYHRQVFKQFLTQKILRDPKQTRSFYQSSGLKDLFKLSEKPDVLHEDATTQVPRAEMAVDSSDDEEEFDGATETLDAGNTEEAMNISSVAREQSKQLKKKSKKTSGGDSWLLSGLMGQEISAKVDHEAVIDKATGHRGKGSTVEAYVEHEAENLASRAVEMLRRSRSSSTALSSSAPSARVSGTTPIFGMVSRAPSSLATKSVTPTISGLGADASKTGLSGSEIVSSLKENSVHPLVETQAHLVQIKNFFLKLNGTASSQQIADWFQAKVPQRQLHLFRSLLRKIADFDPQSRFWTLKSWAGGALPAGQDLL